MPKLEQTTRIPNWRDDRGRQCGSRRENTKWGRSVGLRRTAVEMSLRFVLWLWCEKENGENHSSIPKHRWRKLSELCTYTGINSNRLSNPLIKRFYLTMKMVWCKCGKERKEKGSFVFCFFNQSLLFFYNFIIDNLKLTKWWVNKKLLLE